jgi:hypothetical protein
MSTSQGSSAAKLSEQAWHDKWYDENARREFPDSAADFRVFFSRVQLEPFCDGGWAYWGDARTEMMRIIGDVRGLTVSTMAAVLGNSAFTWPCRELTSAASTCPRRGSRSRIGPRASMILTVLFVRWMRKKLIIRTTV